MIDPFVLRIEFFEGLVAIDEAIVERAAGRRAAHHPRHGEGSRDDDPRRVRGPTMKPDDPK